MLKWAMPARVISLEKPMRSRTPSPTCCMATSPSSTRPSATRGCEGERGMRSCSTSCSTLAQSSRLPMGDCRLPHHHSSGERQGRAGQKWRGPKASTPWRGPASSPPRRPRASIRGGGGHHDATRRRTWAGDGARRPSSFANIAPRMTRHTACTMTVREEAQHVPLRASARRSWCHPGGGRVVARAGRPPSPCALGVKDAREISLALPAGEVRGRNLIVELVAPILERRSEVRERYDDKLYRRELPRRLPLASSPGEGLRGRGGEQAQGLPRSGRSNAEEIAATREGVHVMPLCGPKLEAARRAAEARPQALGREPAVLARAHR